MVRNDEELNKLLQDVTIAQMADFGEATLRLTNKLKTNLLVYW